jgi:hypothetical protein
MHLEATGSHYLIRAIMEVDGRAAGARKGCSKGWNLWGHDHVRKLQVLVKHDENFFKQKLW